MTNISLRTSQTCKRARCDDGAQPLRVLLAGEFAGAWSDRRVYLERLLDGAGSEQVHQVIPAARCGSDVEHAVLHLERGMVDVVLLGLGGPITQFLGAVGRLRASAGSQVVFIGLHTGEYEAATICYRSAVVDSMLHSWSSGAVLQRGIASAIEAFRDPDDEPAASAPPQAMLRQ